MDARPRRVEGGDGADAKGSGRRASPDSVQAAVLHRVVAARRQRASLGTVRTQPGTNRSGEKPMTIDERLERLAERHEALTQSVELMVSAQRHAAEESEERFLRQEERFLRQDERFLRQDERLLEIAERANAASERHDREIGEIRRELGRAVRLSIQEARNERKRRHEMDERHRQRHEELEVLLKSFLKRGGNGKGPSE